MIGDAYLEVYFCTCILGLETPVGLDDSQ